MRRSMFLRYLVLAGWLLSAVGYGTATGETAITVYNSDLGLVRETRTIHLDEGIHEVALTDVAAQIDPTSVRIKSLTDPATRVLEQNFRYDGLMLERMLVNYLDKEIRLVDRAGQEHTGLLIAIGQTTTPTLHRPDGAGSNDLILLEDDKIVLIEGGPKQVLRPAVDPSLVLVPTLAWLVGTEEGGEHNLELSYLTSGISWSADYNLVTEDESDLADLLGWVTLNNRSGADYRDAKLKLVAGDVRREELRRGARGRDVLYAGAAVMEAAPAFEERGLFEYHLYELQRTTNVLDNEQKQVELLAANAINIERLYIFDANRDSKKVLVQLAFKNDEESNLGMPLPKGRIRMFSRDTDGTLQFVGEASIDHTPKDERIELEAGKTFDLRAERRIVDVKESKMFGRRTRTEFIEVKLRNHKEKDVTIRVREHVGGAREWEITESTHDHEKKDIDTIYFPVTVEKDGESVLEYTIERTWLN